MRTAHAGMAGVSSTRATADFVPWQVGAWDGRRHLVGGFVHGWFPWWLPKRSRNTTSSRELMNEPAHAPLLHAQLAFRGGDVRETAQGNKAPLC